MKKVTDASFGKYGRVLQEYDTSGIVKEMKHTPMPKDVLYLPSDENLEQKFKLAFVMATMRIKKRLNTIDVQKLTLPLQI